MARWSDIATWEGLPADNFGDGDTIAGEASDRMTDHKGIVLHIAEGTYAGTISWFRNPTSDTSSHFVVAKDGRCAQLLDTDDRSWCQADGNSTWLSVEFEGYSTQSLTPSQIRVAASILAYAHVAYGVPLQITDSVDVRGLGWHGMGGYSWGGHYNCPGSAIIAQRSEIIRIASDILDGSLGDDVHVLMRYSGGPEVFRTNGTFATWIRKAGDVPDWTTLSDEGSLPIGFGGAIRVVGNRALIGFVVGSTMADIPPGWEDRAFISAQQA